MDIGEDGWSRRSRESGESTTRVEVILDYASSVAYERKHALAA
jgi:hypothetical protein